MLTNLTDLLQDLIRTPSFSGREDQTATLLQQFLTTHNAKCVREKNNVWSIHPDFQDDRPTLLLNSHHDTVKPNPSYTNDPFQPIIEDDSLYGLGSNDAGGPLVCLLGAFLDTLHQPLHGYNLIFAATAEEEISGQNGIQSILPQLPDIDMAIVGEPTSLQAATAEKGLLVLDCVAHGKPGHAARDEGENAIYKAIKDIEWFRTYIFPKNSTLLGPVKMSVTIIEAGQQHNVVPDICRFTVDVRTTDVYSLEETLDIIREYVSSEVQPRSMRLQPSSLPVNHPLGQVVHKLNLFTYGSPTLSDQALLSCPSLKIGPGDSARSHSANEFIKISELRDGLKMYQSILKELSLQIEQ
jgi:acetylornithine deacetylase